MDIGIQLNGIRPDRLIRMVRAAEEAGFESAWRGDHVGFPAEIPAKYPYADGGSPPFPADWPMLDTFVLFGHLAAHTSRIRFGTGVYIVPMRKPVLLARAVTTADLVSGGRIILGVGVGWMEPEFDIVGEPFATRGERTDEIMQILRKLWTEERASFEGKHYTLPPMAFEPKPIAKPHPPLLVGGQSRAALRRAAQLGDGWYGVGLDPAAAAAAIAGLRAMRTEAGREHLPFNHTLLLNTTGSDLSLEDARRYEDAGIDRIVLGFGTNTRNADAMALLERSAERLAPYLGHAG